MAVEDTELYEADPFCAVLGYQGIFASLFSFLTVRYIVLRFLLWHQRGNTLNGDQRALLANHMVSYLHALASSAMVIGLFVKYPALLQDMQGVHSGDQPVQAARKALAFSTGYFVADCTDMLVSGVYRWNKGIWGHHLVAISCYVGGIQTCSLYPYLVSTLIVEVNSIFLHHRKVLSLYYPVDKGPIPKALDESYDIATNLLLWTFPPARLVGNLYITYRVFVEAYTWQAAAWTWWVAAGGMLIVDWYNWGLWKQVQRSIARDRARRTPKAHISGELKKTDDWVGQSGTALID